MIHATHNGFIAIRHNERAHFIELIHVHEAILEHGLFNAALPFRNAHQCHELRLHIRWKARIGQCPNLRGFQTPVGLHENRIVIIILNGHADLLDLRQNRTNMVGENVTNLHGTARHRRSHNESGGFNAIGNNRMTRTMQFFDPFHQDGRGSRAAHFGAHFIQEIRQIRDLRLLGGILNHCFTFRHGRRHHDILRRTNRGKIQVDLAAD